MIVYFSLVIDGKKSLAGPGGAVYWVFDAICWHLFLSILPLAFLGSVRTGIISFGCLCLGSPLAHVSIKFFEYLIAIPLRVVSCTNYSECLLCHEFSNKFLDNTPP